MPVIHSLDYARDRLVSLPIIHLKAIPEKHILQVFAAFDTPKFDFPVDRFVGA
jgi:hypothetical protein